MGAPSTRAGFAGIAAALILLVPSHAAAAKDKPLGKGWVSLGSDPIYNLSFDDSNLSEIGLERTADGVLHVAWTHDVSGFGLALLHSTMPGADPDSAPSFDKVSNTVVTTDASSPQGLNPSTDLVSTPDGGLRVFFSGLFPGRAYDGVMASASLPAGADDFDSPSPISDTAPPSPVYAAAGIGAAVDQDGLFMTTWGDSSPSGGGYHFGLSPSTPDLPFTDACCEIDPNIAVDSASGETMIASNLIDSGIQISSFDTGKTYVAPKSTAAWTQQRTSISGRIDAPGIWVAYGTGTNMFNAKPALWEVGAPKFRFLKNQDAAAHVGMAPAPGGRMWLYWERDHRLYASRTDPSGGTFGSVVSLQPKDGSRTVYRLIGEGSLGTLDLFALTKQGDHLEWSVERVPPGLKLKAIDNTVKAGQSIDFKVTDAGDPVKGAEVTAKIDGKNLADTSNGSGIATLKIPGSAKGLKKAAVEKSGYARMGNTDRIAAFNVTG